MCYVKVKNNIVIQKQYTPGDGFIKINDDNVVCGYILKGNNFIQPEKTIEEKWQDIRIERNKKFIQLGFPYRLEPNLEMATIPKEIRDILQKLRDIPQTFSNPDDIIWPEFTPI